MRAVRNNVNAIVAEAFRSRVEAVEALRDPGAGSDVLRAAAVAAAGVAERLGRAQAAADWSALAVALEILAFLADWARAVSEAEPEADRHLRAARQRLRRLADDDDPAPFPAAVASRLAPVALDMDPDDLPGLRAAIGSIPMPVSILADPKPEPWRGIDADPQPKREDLAVAFLEFTIDGGQAANLHALSPREVHDLGLVIRVSRWPAGAEALAIEPISAEPRSAWDLPSFSFPKPEGEPPYTFQRNGRMVINAPQGFDARPLEFIYAAQFSPTVEDERVVVAGQRRLRLDGLGPQGQAVSGYDELDAAILQVRRALRADPMIPEEDVRSVVTLLQPLANLAGAAVQDALYPAPVSEAVFETGVRDRLRAVPAIGSELEQQAQAAGGRTDLSFRGVRLELKSERAKRLLPADCARFAAQAATYAVGTGKRVAVLAVLDCSPKDSPPIPLGSCLFLDRHDSGAGEISVVTVLVQGCFPRPSDFSR